MARRTTLLASILVVIGCGGGDEAASEPDGALTDASADGSDAASDANGDTNDASPPPSVDCLLPSSKAGAPKLPVERVDTKLVVPTGKTLAVKAGGDFQKALADAQPGDVITLEAGATFEGSFQLPEKSGDGWIVIRSSAPDSELPKPGERATPKHAGKMPKLVAKTALPVITTAARAHHYRFIGIEMRPADGVDVNDLVALGSTSVTSAAEQAHHIVIDRCFVHGDPKKGGKRGIALNSAHTAVVDSWVSDWKRVGQDTQAIGGWNGPGPFKVVNNYLEGAGENVMWGGADPRIKDLVPSDIELCRNHFAKPLRWKEGDPSYEGTHWSVKNLFELKMARRIVVSGNVFESCWADAQTGFAIVLKTADQDGGSPWAITEDVTFAYNVVKRSAGGMAISPRDTSTSQKTRSLLVFGNVFFDIGGDAWGGNGRLFQVLGVANLSFEHNTGFGKSHTMIFDGETNASFVVRDNVFGQTTYGVFGSGAGEGKSSLDKFAPGAVFTGNVLAGAKAASYPPGNFFPASDAEIGFVDAAKSDYRLAPSSAYAKKGSDGSDPGADFESLGKATSGVVVAP